MEPKPKHRSGYSAQATDAIRSVCLTVATAIGDHREHVIVVGGLVPTLLTEGGFLDMPPQDEGHTGTMDLDLGLALSVLDNERYQQISSSLRSKGFAPDENEKGNPTRQRWHRDGLKVDFLIQPSGDAPDATSPTLQNLEKDFAALQVKGIQLAFSERCEVELSGVTLEGHKANREIGVCGPAAFIVLKAMAFHNRTEPKDAYDLVFTIRQAIGGPAEVAQMLRRHWDSDGELVDDAMRNLASDFASLDHVGPQRFADFVVVDDAERDDAAADARGFVDDLLRAYL